MKRRFLQFSLRGLLGVVILACLSLGSWHLLDTYGNRLDVENPKAGAPIRIRARFVRPLGPSECALEVGYSGGFGPSAFCDVKRSWLCFYTMEAELEQVESPCQLLCYACLSSDAWDIWQEKTVNVK